MDKILMKKIKVLAVLPYTGLKELVTTIANSYEQIQITSMVGDLEVGANLASQAANNEYDIVLSRGGTAQMIASIVKIPVINIDVSGYDILSVIKLAQSFSGKSALVGFPNITQGATIICELLQSSVSVNTIHSEEEAVYVLETLRQEGFSVIIGDVVTIRLAKKNGFNGILVTSGVESVKRAFEELLKTYTYLSVSLAQSKFYKNVINSALEAIVVFSDKGQLLYKSSHTVSDEFMEDLKSRIESVLNQGYVRIMTSDKQFTWSVTGKRIQADDDVNYNVAFYVEKVIENSSKPYRGIRFINENDKNSLSFFAFADNSEALIDTIRQAKEYAKIDQPVLIIGENGTGKSALAYAMHLNSDRRHNTFVSLDCECITDEQWKAIMTEQYPAFPADNDYTGLTIYLNRIDSLSIEAQKLILAYITISQKHNLPRIIASSNTSLEFLLEKSTFLEELYNSVSFLNLYILPLRERTNDIGNFVSIFISKCNEKYGKQIVGIDEAALKLLQEQVWEGNLEQLKRTTEEMVILCKGLSIGVNDVESVLRNWTKKVDKSKDFLDIHLGKTLDEITTEIINTIFEREGMNHLRTAKILGISRSTLWRKLKDREKTTGK
jgi:propionate catabolism operon transcriptional regulator